MTFTRIPNWITFLQRNKIAIDNFSSRGDIQLTKRRSTSSPIDSFQIAAGAILPPPPAPAAI
jgi:hypothetical protein